MTPQRIAIALIVVILASFFFAYTVSAWFLLVAFVAAAWLVTIAFTNAASKGNVEAG